MNTIDARELRAHPELVRELREKPGEHVERRYMPMAQTNVAVRANGDDQTFKLGGLAAVFDTLSLNLGGFREKFERGAFRNVLKTEPDVRCLLNHDANYLLGRTTSGTLRLKELPRGLDYECDAPETSYANDLRALMARGDLNQSSFAFRVAPGGDAWEEDPETGVLIRTVREVGALYDVSPVTDPAYPAATAGIRDRPDDEQHDQDASERSIQAEAHGGDGQADDVDAREIAEELAVLEARQRQLHLRSVAWR